MASKYPMGAPNGDTARKGLRGWWASPPRSGMRLIISPWEYRHLRIGAGLHIAGGIVLACLAFVTLAFGGSDAKTYLWSTVFLVPGLANLAFAFWELGIASSASGEPDLALLALSGHVPKTDEPAAVKGGSVVVRTTARGQS